MRPSVPAICDSGIRSGSGGNHTWWARMPSSLATSAALATTASSNVVEQSSSTYAVGTGSISLPVNSRTCWSVWCAITVRVSGSET